MEAQAHLLLVPRVDADALGQVLPHARAAVVQLRVQLVVRHAVVLAVVVQERVKLQHAVRAVVLKLRLHPRVAQMDLRQRQQVYVAQYPRHTPLVLILQVRAIAQPVDLHRQQIAARLHKVRDVKLRAHVRRLGEPRLDAVDIHRERAVHAVKAQQDAPLILLPHRRHREFPAV